MKDALFYALLIALLALGIYAAWKAAPGPRRNSEIVCPHCCKRGDVMTMAAVRKRGISGGKATGALFTGGLSMVATGLSRKQLMTHMRCLNCGTEWDVA